MSKIDHQNFFNTAALYKQPLPHPQEFSYIPVKHPPKHQQLEQENDILNIAQMVNSPKQQKDSAYTPHINTQTICVSSSDIQDIVIPEKKTPKNINNNLLNIGLISLGTTTAAGLGVTAAGLGVVAGILINKKLQKHHHSTGDTSSPAPPKPGPASATPSSDQFLNNILKALPSIAQNLPSIISASSIGLIGVVGAIGLSSWLNQDTPEKIKARIDSLKNRLV